MSHILECDKLTGHDSELLQCLDVVVESEVAVPFIGAALIIYFEEQDFQEWLDEHPDGDRRQYACEVATYSAEIIDDLVGDTLTATENLPDYLQPNAEKVKTWLEVPKCV